MPGMDAKRADLMPASVILLDVILSQAGELDLVACSWALREGVLLELARVPSAQGPASPAGRRRSIQALATRYAGTNAHGRQVAALALQLFDALAPDLGLPPNARELLEHAAVLHDIGHAIEHDRHQRHTYYLIRGSELLGFSPLEIEVIAQVARAHRKQAPRVSTVDVQALPATSRRLVRGLASLLRLADALDRTHFGVIKELRIARQGGRLVITADPGGESAELELWAAERRVDVLSRLLDRAVVVRARTARARTPERVRVAR
jgi:exopolyphosphatase/guanosine-5'-triphosphate,3'-diphosphate pyrophosphatase